MAIPFILPLKIASTILGQLLPKKPKAVIKQMVAAVVSQDPSVQKAISQWRDYTLKFFGGANVIPTWVLCIRVAGRWYVVILFSTFMVIYYSITGRMPDLWFTKMTGLIITIVVVGRSVEKLFGKTI